MNFEKENIKNAKENKPDKQLHRAEAEEMNCKNVIIRSDNLVEKARPTSNHS